MPAAIHRWWPPPTWEPGVPGRPQDSDNPTHTFAQNRQSKEAPTMLGYYLRLALKSFKRDPGATTLMVFAIGLGVGVCVMTLTVYHAMSGNPIWWKNDRLYAVAMDNWDPNEPYDQTHPLLPPQMMTY